MENAKNKKFNYDILSNFQTKNFHDFFFAFFSFIFEIFCTVQFSFENK